MAAALASLTLFPVHVLAVPETALGKRPRAAKDNGDKDTNEGHQRRPGKKDKEKIAVNGVLAGRILK
jgi:hypothetical protein